MELAPCARMRELDKTAVEEYGIPGIVLMENAALSVFNICKRLYAYRAKNAVIFCGGGNNGGDGFALARHMSNDGVAVSVVLACDPGRIRGDAKINYDICVKMRIDIHLLTEESFDRVKSLSSEAALIVDAVLGTGVSGELKGSAAMAVSIINESGKFVLAIDCPTGGNPDNGKVLGCCVKASLTVTLALLKPGLLLYPLAEYAGIIEVGQIGAPKALVEGFNSGIHSLLTEDAALLLPARKARSHKGTFGKAAIIAGGKGMAGAAAFCAKAAFKAGCGYVVICAPESVTPIIQQLAPQAVIIPLPEKDGFVCGEAAKTALKAVNGSTVCLIGPGLGNTTGTRELVRCVVKKAEVPLIIDADALNVLSDDPDMLKETAYPPIVTPHPLEMSRLTGCSVKHILDNMPESANDFSKKYNVVTVLKDAATIVCREKELYILNMACSALAKAGSGDILAGIIAGLAAQGLTGFHAAALAVFIHGKSGAVAAKNRGCYSVTNDDVLDAMSEVFIELEQLKRELP